MVTEVDTMTLFDARVGEEYRIRSVETGDDELEAFLFSLGCYAGEPITVITRTRTAFIVSIKDGRYNMDRQLAQVIETE